MIVMFFSPAEYQAAWIPSDDEEEESDQQGDEEIEEVGFGGEGEEFDRAMAVAQEDDKGFAFVFLNHFLCCRINGC